jgi:hypothetical protein
MLKGALLGKDISIDCDGSYFKAYDDWPLLFVAKESSGIVVCDWCLGRRRMLPAFDVFCLKLWLDAKR